MIKLMKRKINDYVLEMISETILLKISEYFPHFL